MMILILAIIFLIVGFLVAIHVYYSRPKIEFKISKEEGGEKVTDKFNKDGSISENWFAEEITSREEGFKEVDIAQVKEVLKVTLDILAELSRGTGRVRVVELIEKHRKSE